MLEFEWDPAKNRANVAKHGIDFPAAARIFHGQMIRIRSDRGGEARWTAVGIHEGGEIAVAYTMRGDRIRIISARRASRYERRAYRALYPG